MDSDGRAGREQPHEGKLIQAHRDAKDLTAREAGRRAGLSEWMWRYYERGWRNKNRVYVRVRMSTDTLVAMAEAVGLDPTHLAACRPDAAAAMLRKQAENDSPKEIARLLEYLRDFWGSDVFDTAVGAMEPMPDVPAADATRPHVVR